MCVKCKYYKETHPEYNYCPHCGRNIKYCISNYLIDEELEHMSPIEYIKKFKSKKER